MKPSPSLSRKDLIDYGLLALPLAYCGLPLYIHAPDFYATQFGLSLSLMGVLLLVVRLFDAIQDPLIGYILDRFAKFKLMIVSIALVVLTLSFFGLYNPFGLAGPAWFFLMLLLATTSFSVLSIHLNAQGSLWKKDTHDKSKIVSTREIWSVVGLLLATILPSLLLLRYDSVQSYSFYSIFFVCLMAIAGLMFLRWQKRNVFEQSSPVQTNVWKKTYALLTGNRKFKFFFLIYFLSILASSLPAILVLFYIRDFLGLADLTGAFLLAYFLAAMMSIPLWRRISARLGLEKTWLLSMMMAIVSFIWAGFLGEGDALYYGLICVFTGLALGAELTIPPVILSQLIDGAKVQENTSIFFSLSAFINKLSFAIATALGFFILDLYEFQPAQENSPPALFALVFVYAVLPCILKLLSGAMLFFYTKQKGNDDVIFENSYHGGGHTHA